jgi:hypothetical protein
MLSPDRLDFCGIKIGSHVLLVLWMFIWQVQGRGVIRARAWQPYDGGLLRYVNMAPNFDPTKIKSVWAEHINVECKRRFYKN